MHTEDTQGGSVKQIRVQLTPFTMPDIPLTVRELQQLRHTTQGAAFDVHPLSLLRGWGVLPLKGFKNGVVFF